MADPRDFLYMDMLRRTGQAGDPQKAAIQDRIKEGALIADLVPSPLHPLALPMLGGAAAGWETAKYLGLPQYLPGPFAQTEGITSEPSLENILAALYGFTTRSPWSPQDSQDVLRGKMEE